MGTLKRFTTRSRRPSPRAICLLLLPLFASPASPVIAQKIGAGRMSVATRDPLATHGSPSIQQLPGYSIAVDRATRLDGRLRIDVLVDSASLGGREVELAEITFPAGGQAAPHRHGATELLYVMQGELDHTVNGTTRRLSPGMVGIVRAGDTVTHRVASSEPVRALVIWAPAGEVSRITAGRSGAIVPIPSLADAMTAIGSLRDRWVDAYNRGQVEGMLDLYTDDAVRMPYDAPAQTGRDSVIAGYTRSFNSRSFTPAIRLEAVRVELRGDLAIERGSYDETLVPRSGGPTLREVGKYVSVMRRGSDGNWRFAMSIFNRDAPPSRQ